MEPSRNLEDLVFSPSLNRSLHINGSLFMSSLLVLRFNAKFCTGFVLSLSSKTRKRAWMMGLFKSIQSNSSVPAT